MANDKRTLSELLTISEVNLKRIFEIRWSNYVEQNKGQKEKTSHTTAVENKRVLI